MEDMSAEIYRELGEHSAQLEHIGKTVDKLSDGMTSLSTKVDALVVAQAQSQGSSKTLWKVGGAGGGAAALIVSVLQYLASLKGGQPAPPVPPPVLQADRPAVNDPGHG